MSTDQYARTHFDTPVLAVFESRGCAVRRVDYYRADGELPAQPRVTQHRYDARGRLQASCDARLSHESQCSLPFNSRFVRSLSGKLVACENVDSGSRCTLLTHQGDLSWQKDGRGNECSREYDLSGRPLAVFERGENEDWICSERYEYADNSPINAVSNNCGRVIRHDQPSGTLRVPQRTLNGQLARQAYQFLKTLDAPDWPELANARDVLLEEGEAAVTEQRYNALGELYEHIDCRSHARRYRHDVCGQLKAASLQLSHGNLALPLIVSREYDAQGKVTAEVFGNGVSHLREFDHLSGALVRAEVKDAARGVIQDLCYRQDPTGNLLQVKDVAQPRRFFRNKQVQAACDYVYDSLYQLIEASGRETACPSFGPELPGLQPVRLDPESREPYRERYRYDAAGNLLELNHVGAVNFTRRMAVSARSNRSAPERNDELPGEEEIAAQFDANGNTLRLQGHELLWGRRNQLYSYSTVRRRDGQDDAEYYGYDHAGWRVRKVRLSVTSEVTHCAQTRYLPGVELRSDTARNESLEVIGLSVGDTTVRVLHWRTGRPENLDDNSVFYPIRDYSGSVALELNEHAAVVSQEGYYPFGGTSWWSAVRAPFARLKYRRYCAKERDATGLYDFGQRYYVPWLYRWLNPDPAGDVDGLNRYLFCGCNPISRIDKDGRMWQPIDDGFVERAIAMDIDPGVLASTVEDLERSSVMAEFVQYERELYDDYGITLRPWEPAEAPPSPQSEGNESPGSIGSPGGDYLERAVPEGLDPASAYRWNSRGLLQRDSFAKSVYRAGKRDYGTIRRTGFTVSTDFGGINKMISGESLIVAETLEGAQNYARMSGSIEPFHFFEIQAENVSGVSLMENWVINNEGSLSFVDYLDEARRDPIEVGGLTGNADVLDEAHISLSDLSGQNVRYLGQGSTAQHWNQIPQHLRRQFQHP